MDLEQLTDLYLERRGGRLKGIERFWNGPSGFMIVQRPAGHLWGECNSVEGVYRNNLRHFESALALPWSDELPHLQPWFGTVVYANAHAAEANYRLARVLLERAYGG